MNSNGGGIKCDLLFFRFSTAPSKTELSILQDFKLHCHYLELLSIAFL